MILIVGLGNPDKKYHKTYHNIGFLCVDALCAALGGTFSKKIGNAIVAEVFYMGQKLLLAKPQTYMNLSGESVLKIKSKFKIENENILILLDDIDLEVGKIRYRKEGSGGTHNGLKNIVQLLGTQSVPRLRIGIGNDTRMDLADYVLSNINDQNWTVLQDSILQAVDFVITDWLDKK
jgi:peptidyl-tRNA hydrolase, PTH1 family